MTTRREGEGAGGTKVRVCAPYDPLGNERGGGRGVPIAAIIARISILPIAADAHMYATPYPFVTRLNYNNATTYCDARSLIQRLTAGLIGGNRAWSAAIGALRSRADRVAKSIRG